MYRIVRFHKKNNVHINDIYIFTTSLGEALNMFNLIYTQTKPEYDLQNYEYVEIYNKDVVKLIQQKLGLDDFYLQFPYILHQIQIDNVLRILHGFNYTFDKRGGIVTYGKYKELSGNNISTDIDYKKVLQHIKEKLDSWNSKHSLFQNGVIKIYE